MESIKVRAGERWMPEDGPGGENLWAIGAGYHNAIINNTPFWTEGLALYDLVSYDDEGDIGMILRPSGIKTFRAIVVESDEGGRFEKVYEDVRKFAIAAEGGFGTLLAVSVAPTLTDTLTRYFDENDIAWENGN